MNSRGGEVVYFADLGLYCATLIASQTPFEKVGWLGVMG